jgi:hypothetical protein
MAELHVGSRVHIKSLNLDGTIIGMFERAGYRLYWHVITRERGGWLSPVDDLVPLDGDTKGDADMEEKFTTYQYEVLVWEKKDSDGRVIRNRQVLARSTEPTLEAPTREDLLMQYAKEIAAVGAKAAEVVINIVPFAR